MFRCSHTIIRVRITLFCSILEQNKAVVHKNSSYSKSSDGYVTLTQETVTPSLMDWVT